MITIALLRAVNLAGHNPVAMADLRTWLARLGFADAQSLLQSGNLVFRASSRSSASIERLLEGQALEQLGLGTDFFVRSRDEWKAVIAGNPFPAMARSDPGHLVVAVLKDAPAGADVDALRAAISGPETLSVSGRHAYIVYPAGIGRSKLTTSLIDRKLRTRGTARNWNTVLKLGALADTL